MNGIYVTYYTGVSGTGHALFAMKDGVIVGADAVGGMLDGTYKHIDNSRIELSINLASLPGTTLVTGKVVENSSFVQEISGKIPENFANGNSIPIQTSTGPINAIFKRLRDLP